MKQSRSRSSFSRVVEILSWKTVAPLLFAGVAFLTYATSLHGEFVFDDLPIVFQNPQLLNVQTFAEVFKVTEKRPPVYITYGLNYYLGGLNPSGYHVLNVALHAVNAFIAFCILLELGAGRWAALVGGMFFTVHPLLTGAVSYIAGRSSVLCGTFYFIAVLGFLRFMRPSRLSSRWLFLGFTVVAGGLAWATKQEAITLPLFLAGYLWIRAGRRHWRYLALMSLTPILALLVFRHEIMQLSTSQNADLVEAGYDPALLFPVYFRTYVTASVLYILPRFVVPVRLNVDPDIRAVDSWYAFSFLFSLYIVASLAGAAVLLKERHLLFRAGILGILISPLAAYAVFPLADVIQEHRIYIAGLGVALISAWITDWSYRRFGTRAGYAITAALVFLGVMTVNRNRVWANSIALWEDAVEKSPQKPRVHVNLGQAYQVRGHLADALKQYEIALQLKPDLLNAQSNAALVYVEQGNLDRAKQVLEKLRRTAPSFVEGWSSLGTVYVHMGQPDQALEVLNQSLELKPRSPAALFARGEAFAVKGQYERAISDYKASLSLQPHATMVRMRLGAIYRRAGELRDAEEQFRILASDPVVGADALRNLGVMKSDAGDYNAAIAYFERSLGLRPNYPDVHHDLGIVFLRERMLDHAISEFQVALAQKPDFELAFLSLSEAYKENGRNDQARQVLERYVQAFSGRDSAYLHEAYLRLQTLR